MFVAALSPGLHTSQISLSSLLPVFLAVVIAGLESAERNPSVASPFCKSCLTIQFLQFMAILEGVEPHASLASGSAWFLSSTTTVLAQLAQLVLSVLHAAASTV